MTSELNNDDIADEVITQALAAFGKQVATQSAARQDFVIANLRAEMERVRPMADRFINGPGKRDPIAGA
jgi:hypothetical protein